MSTSELNANGTTLWALPDPDADQISGGRRRDKRYEIELETRWKLIRRRKVLASGSGRTVDLSSGGILIEADRPLPVGLNVELSIAWPVLLYNTAPLQLVVAGKIVRSEGTRTAIRMVQHEFRTIGALNHRAAPQAGEMPVPLPLLSGVAQSAACD